MFIGASFFNGILICKKFQEKRSNTQKNRQNTQNFNISIQQSSF